MQESESTSGGVSYWTPTAFAAAVIAYFEQSFVAIAPTEKLSTIGLAFGFAIIAAHAHWEKPAWWKLVAAIGGVVGGSWAFDHVSRDVVRQQTLNNARCLTIQRDMLSARPRRADGRDLFQALGCRPQGEGSVYAPPRKDMKK